MPRTTRIVVVLEHANEEHNLLTKSTTWTTNFYIFFFLLSTSGLKDENKKLHGQIKEQELAAESEKQLTNRLKQSLERQSYNLQYNTLVPWDK